MIKNLMRYGLPVLALAALPLLTTTVPATAHTTTAEGLATTQTAVGAAGMTAVRERLPLFEAIDRIPVAEEHRAGYKRNLYKHWNRGLNATDGCDTRVICTLRPG
ncbi:hypothetical protein AB0D14_32495 [Streptomyces sp. NPDC048484]|uniref:hypothetical protein n=1 Tax=Streptomyces sp. NPDC048484 TaxID=3155146 RepID=UPI0034425D2C